MTLYDWYLKINPKSFFVEMNKLEVPWKDFNNLLNLDTLYFEIHARNLIVSSWAEKIDVANAVNVVYSTYINNWNKLWQNYIAEYNPIENYSMVENLSEITNKISNIEHNEDEQKTSNRNTTGTTTSESDTSIFTFNNASNNGVKSDRGVNVTTPDIKNNDSSNNTKNFTENNTDDNTIERELKRSGNIGVTTSAQMISENIELWKWNYFEQIFNDIDKIMSIGVYDYDN